MHVQRGVQNARTCARKRTLARTHSQFHVVKTANRIIRNVTNISPLRDGRADTHTHTHAKKTHTAKTHTRMHPIDTCAAHDANVIPLYLVNNANANSHTVGLYINSFLPCARCKFVRSLMCTKGGPYTMRSIAVAVYAQPIHANDWFSMAYMTTPATQMALAACAGAKRAFIIFAQTRFAQIIVYYDDCFSGGDTAKQTQRISHNSVYGIHTKCKL